MSKESEPTTTGRKRCDMSYESTTFNVMIASPGDVAVQRVIVREVIYEWNAIHSMQRRFVLLPVGWESHSSPDMGDRPQAIINKQVLANCDLLVAIFATRLGTETGKHESGTVEEIKEHIALGKPTMLYFSTNLGSTINFDVEQFKRLQAFQKWCSNKGLYETYDSDNVFRHKFSRQLQLKVNQHSLFNVGNPERSHSADPPPTPADDDSHSIVFSLSTIASDAAKGAARSPRPELTEKARTLLKAASLDPSGYILVLSTLSGTAYQVNNEQVNTTNDRRELALWDEALDQLESARLIRQRDTTGKGLLLYELVSAGYAVADLISSETNDWIA
jgi:hypothetical protein